MASAQRILIPAALLLISVSAVCSAQTQDKEGCTDSPLIGRFPGSVITDCKNMDDDKFTFTLDGSKQKAVEGEFHRIRYEFPKTASKAQVVRNLNTALRRAGYTMVYDSGDYGDFTGHMGKTWIQIEISTGGGIDETIVVEKALTQDVVANAAELSTNLKGAGHAVVNGIFFDTGKAEVKVESTAALDEVAKLLKENASLKLYVVGHTDTTGGLAANLDLSRKRAAAVVDMLVSKYSVAADRLSAFGAGPYAPLASNDSEDGRAMNRRVELVKQ
jgi:outer membrane protein OmpA-like peptidoglycan-associated protein